MKKLLAVGILFAVVPFLTYAQVSTVGTSTSVTSATTNIADPGLIPGDFFYFLDRWTEVLNTTLTFNKEKKARKHLEYAKERVAEISEVLKNPSAKLDDIESTKDDFDSEIADAVELVESLSAGEVAGTSDILEDLASELNEDLDIASEALKDIFREHKNKSSHAEEELRAKLASLLPTDPQVQGLTQALESLTKEKNDADKEKNDLDIDFDDEQEFFEKIMGKEMSAQKQIDEAMRVKAEVEALAGQIPADVVASSVALLNQAKLAEERGDFEMAKKLSKEAKKALEQAREMGDDNDDFEDDEDEISGSKDIDVDSLDEEIKKSEAILDGLNR